MARRFKNLDDVRRYLGSLINRVEGGQITPTIAGKLAYISNILKSAITEADLEQRLAKLETLLSKEDRR